MRVFERPDALFRFAFANMRQANEEKDGSNNHENDAEREIRKLDCLSTVNVGLVEELKNQITADERAGCRAEGIERLCKIQAAGSGSFRSENRHVRIGCNLQHRK